MYHNTRLILFFITFYLFSFHVCGNMCHVTCVEARGQLKEFLFYHVSWDLTQVARLEGTHLYLRSHLISLWWEFPLGEQVSQVPNRRGQRSPTKNSKTHGESSSRRQGRHTLSLVGPQQACPSAAAISICTPRHSTRPNIQYPEWLLVIWLHYCIHSVCLT